jgi:hypothetical protein
MYVNLFGQQANAALEGLGQDAACGLGAVSMKRRTAAPAKTATPSKAAFNVAASSASALARISMAPTGWQNAMKANGAIMYSKGGAFDLIPPKGSSLSDTALLPAFIAHVRAVQRCVGWRETGVADAKMLMLLKAINKTPAAQRSMDPGLVKFLKDRIQWSRSLSGLGATATDAALMAGGAVAANALVPGGAPLGVKAAGAAAAWAFGSGGGKHKYHSPEPDKATLSLLGKVIAEKRLVAAKYQPVLAEITKEAVWYGPLMLLFSVVGDYNRKVVVDGRLKSDGFFKKGNFKAGRFEFGWTRQLPFMRLVAAVNHVMGYPGYVKKGKKPELAMATPLVLMFLSYMRHEHQNSALGKFVYDNITWSLKGRDSKYKKLDSKDMVRISSELTRLGGVNSVSDAIMAIYKAGDTAVPPPRYVPKAAAKPADKPAAKKSPSKKIGRKKAAQIGKSAAKPAEEKSAAKPAEEKAAAQQAPLKLTAVAAKIGAKPSDMAKVASAQSGKVTLKLRDQLVLSATNLMRVGRGKQQELAGAKQQLAEASTPEEKAQAQAKVQQVEAQVQQAQAETSKVEQAIAQVDNAMALSTAAQAAAVEATQGDSQATAFAASKAAAATSAAVQAAANVLPAQNIAGAIKEAVTETQQEVASQAEQAGDDSLTRALQALSESQVMQDAVKEGAASAEALSEEGGSEEGGSEEGGSEEGGSEEGGSEEGGSEEGGSEEETAPTDGLSGIGGSNEPSVLGIVLATAGGIGLAWLGARNSRR